MEDEKLIAAVRKYPCLWNTSSASYRDIKAKDATWKQVAIEVGQPSFVGKCMKRWKNIRDRFVRELKKTKQNNDEDGDPSYVSSWPMFNKLLFLQDIVRHRQAQSGFSSPSHSEIPSVESLGDGGSDSDSLNICDMNVSSEVGLSNNFDSTSSTCLQPTKRRKKSDRDDPISLSRTIDHEDEDELYGRQLAATLRRLPGWKKAYAKVQIQKVLWEIEYPNEQGAINKTVTENS